MGFVGVYIGLEIGTDTATQVDRFAYVDDFAVLIFVEINTRAGGQIFQYLFDAGRWLETHTQNYILTMDLK